MAKRKRKRRNFKSSSLSDELGGMMADNAAEVFGYLSLNLVEQKIVASGLVPIVGLDHKPEWWQGLNLAVDDEVSEADKTTAKWGIWYLIVKQ